MGDQFFAPDSHRRVFPDVSYDEELHRALSASAERFQEVENQRHQSQVHLLKALDLHGAYIRPVAADGNCQFRALSVALDGNEEGHAALRAQAVQQMKKAPEDYAPFVHEPYSAYLDRLARDGEWGDNLTLQALSDALVCRIKIITDVPGAEILMVYPKKLKSTEGLVQQPLWSLRQPLCITFQTEWHYDAAFGK